MVNAATTTGNKINLSANTSPSSEMHESCPLKHGSASLPAETTFMISSTSVEHLPDPVSVSVIPVESVDPASNTTMRLSISSVIPKSLEDNTQPPTATVKNTTEELELPGVVEHTDCHSTGASNTAMPAIQSDASIDSRPGQRKRRKRHLGAKLKDAVSQRLFTYLRKKVLFNY